MGMSSELKVGALFFIGMGLAGYFTFQLTDLRAEQGRFQVEFHRVARIKEGDIVTYNGVKAGVVTAVEPALTGEGEARRPVVRIAFSIDARKQPLVLIGPSTRFRVSQGVLGGATLDISSTDGVAITPESLKGRLGEDPASLDEAMAAVQRLVEENREGVKGLISSARTGMDAFGGMSNEVKEAVAENRPALKDAVVGIRDASRAAARILEANEAALQAAIAHFDEMTVQIRDLVAENRASIQAATAKLPKAVDELGGAAAEIRGVVADNRENLKRTIDNAAAITDDVKVATAQIAAGKGTIGKLVMDEAVHDRALSALSAVEQRAEEIRPLTSGISDLKLYLGLESGGNATTGATTTYAYLRVEPRSWKFYEGGVSYRTAPYGRDIARDDPDKVNVDLNVLVGWRFLPNDAQQNYRLTVAGGLIDTQIGGYVEAPLAPNLALRVMARRKDASRADTDRRFEEGETLVRATMQWRLWDRIYVIAGGDDLAGQPALWGGLRAELLDNDLRNLTTAASLGR